MLFLLIATGLLLLATLLLSLVVWVLLSLFRGRPSRFWRRTLSVHVVLVPIHLFLTVPGLFGWVGSRLIHTRPDESAYAGPRVSAGGEWVLQSQDSLRAEREEVEREGGVEVAPAIRALEEQCTVKFRASDGLLLRGFLVPPLVSEPRCSVVVVHGLFRGGLEMEPVAAMFRELGAEVLMLELRNHGGSGRAPATFGLYESRDVVAAVEWLHARPEHGERQVVLFGVSLGTAAVSLAAARLPNVAGLVLDAPMDDLLMTGHRMLALSREGRSGMAMPEPFRSLIFASIEFWSDFEFERVRPRDALLGLSPDVPVLFIGGGDDERMPPAGVEALFAEIPTRLDLKALWIREGSDHGAVWSDDPDGYQRHLREFLDVVVSQPAGQATKPR